MKRITTTPRENWQKRMEESGVKYHSDGQIPTEEKPGVFWKEDAYWEFTAKDVDEIEVATNELYKLCVDACHHIIYDEPEIMNRMLIPTDYQQMIRDSWEVNDVGAPSIYGRMDLAYDGKSTPKLIEFNADTPTLLVESAVGQWYWLKDKFGESGDQFNSIHERLIESWKWMKEQHLGEKHLYFTSCKWLEEFSTVEYLRDTCSQAGVNTDYIAIDKIGWDGYNFIDEQNWKMDFIFKLYPWEWLWDEEFGKHIPVCAHSTGWIEPQWKMLMTTKALLPVLWKLFPDHPNLLECTWDKPANPMGYYAKPIYGREGNNIDYYTLPAVAMSVGGDYQAPKIWQKGANTFIEGKYVNLGSWLIGGEAAGMIIRESDCCIIQDKSPVLPHRLV